MISKETKMIQNAAPVITRVPAEAKVELAALAKEHNRSVAGEARQALEMWLAVNRRPVKA